MIWSLTPYCGEADILEIRLATLEGVVDRHVICEARQSQRGQPKPLLYLEQQPRFERWAEQIDYVVATFDSEQSNWSREHAQRDCLRSALSSLQPDDLVLISDVDEIPAPEFLRPELAAEHPVKLQMAMHMYYLNWRWREVPVRNGTRATLVRGAKLLSTPEHTLTEFCEAGFPAVPEQAGWHLAYQLSAADIRAKVGSIADDWCLEWAERPAEHFEHCRRTGWDLFDREYRECDWVGDEALPPYAVANRERFAHMFCPPPGETP